MFTELPEIDPTPAFDCDIRLNLSNCSLIKLSDCFDGNREEFVQKLIRSFRYLPNCDIRRILLAKTSIDPELKNPVRNNREIVLFQKIKLNSNVDLNNEIQNSNFKITKKLLIVLFSFAKKNLNELRSASSNSLNSDSSSSSSSSISNRVNSGQKYVTLRHSINDFLHYIKKFSFKLSSKLAGKSKQNLGDGGDEEDLYQLFMTIIHEFKNLVLFTGRMSQFFENFLLPNCRKNSWTDETERRTAFYNYYHVCLQIWWTFVEVTFSIFGGEEFVLDCDVDLLKNFDDTGTKLNLFEQTLRLLLFDVLLISFDRFKSSTFDSAQLNRTSPFSCSCICEIWTMAKLLLRNFENSNLDRFYQFTFDTVSKIVDNSTLANVTSETDSFSLDRFKSIVVIDRIDCLKNSNPNLYPIWIFSNLVPLFSIDFDSRSKFYHRSNIPISIPSLLVKHYRLTLKQLESNQTHDQQSSLISTLINLTSNVFDYCLIPSFDVLIQFVEYFLKRLNTNFNLKSSSLNHHNSFTSIESYQFIPKNGTDKWKQIVREICYHQQDYHRESSLNCFKIFLNLTLNQLTMLFGSEDDQPEDETLKKFQNLNFQKLISKIVVTLQPRILRSLDSLGVFNLCSFYLVLVESIPEVRWNDISDKVLNVFFNEIFKESKNSFSQVSLKPSSQNDKNRTKQIEQILLKFLFTTISLIESKPDRRNRKKKKEEIGSMNQTKVCERLSKLVNRTILETINDNSNIDSNIEIIIQYFYELELLLQHLDRTDTSSIIGYIDNLLLLTIDLPKLYQSILPHSNANSQSTGRSLCNNLLLEILNIVLNGLECTGFPDWATTKFPNRLLEKLVPLIRNEFYFGEEIFSDMAFNCTKISFKISCIQSSNLAISFSSSLNLIQQFLHYPDSKFVSNSVKIIAQIGGFQIKYLCLLFDDDFCLNQLISSVSEQQQFESMLIQSWIRLLILDDNLEQLDLVSERLFTTFFESSHRYHQDSLPQFTSKPNSLDYFKCFLCSLNGNYAMLSTFESKMNQIEQLSRYIRPLLLESVPHYLNHSINQSVANNSMFCGNSSSKLLVPFFSNIGRIYSLFSYLIQLCSRQLYVVGKSDCLLALILETVLIPSSNSSPLVSHEHSYALFQKCFPLILEGLCKLNPECDPYIERKIRQIIVFYFPFLVKNSSYDEIKKSFTRDQIFDSWCTYLDQTIEKVYLQPQRQTEPLSRSIFDYLNSHFQFHHQESKTFFIHLSKLILITNGSNLVNEFNLNNNNKDYRCLLIQTIVSRAVLDSEQDPDQAKNFIEKILGPFISANLQSRPAKLFEIVKYLLPPRIHRTEQQLIFRELCAELTRQLDLVERRSLSGNHSVLRKLFKEFILNYEQRN